MTDLATLIRQGALQRGLDPQAVLAVAGQEGISGRVGDQGTSFGPFQLHYGGAYPSFAPQGAPASQAWAQSPAGINYALDRIASVARGLTGRGAVDAIVRRFERPADPTGESARAWASYGGSAPPGTSVSPSPDMPQTLPSALPKLNVPGLMGPSLSSMLPALLKGGDALTNSLLHASDAAVMAVPKFELPGMSTATAELPTTMTPGKPADPSKWVTLAPGADRKGVMTSASVLDAVARIGQQFGKPLTISTGTNHNEYVVGTHRESQHWEGNAADIPASGAELTRLGQAALVAAGMDPAEAAKQTGGVFNVGGWNILFNTHVGGNHFNHLHVGV